MGRKRIFWLCAVITMVALPWLAMADNQSRPVATNYKLQNASAPHVAKSLAELLHDTNDIKIAVPVGAEGKERGNELLVIAFKEDQATIAAFLALVDRRSRLLFPEEVERAMMGDRAILPRGTDLRPLPYRPMPPVWPPR